MLTSKRSLVTFAHLKAHVLISSPINMSKAFLEMKTEHIGTTLILNVL
jgi:hypothetical protein